MRFEDRRTLVENREEILRRTKVLGAELRTLWQDQALAQEDRAAFAPIDIYWVRIEYVLRVPPGRIVEGPEAD